MSEFTYKRLNKAEPDFSVHRSQFQLKLPYNIKPERILLLFVLTGILAAVIPLERRSVDVMTPFYAKLSGLYGHRYR